VIFAYTGITEKAQIMLTHRVSITWVFFSVFCYTGICKYHTYCYYYGRL